MQNLLKIWISSLNKLLFQNKEIKKSWQNSQPAFLLKNKIKKSSTKFDKIKRFEYNYIDS